MKKDNSIDGDINEYLSNEKKSLNDDFTRNVLNQIKSIEKRPIQGKRKISLFPVIVFGFASCLLFFFIITSPNHDLVDSSMNKISFDESRVTTLGESEQVMLEDLMALPDELDESSMLFIEETYDLLVLLDY